MTLPTDPVWFVTGCSTGLGRELAQQVLAKGWRAIATARDAAAVEELADEGGDRCRTVALDITKPDQVKAA